MARVSRDVVDRLYTSPPEGFVAARNEAVAAARAAGDADTARELAKLRKPTLAAWLVNLLAIRRPDLVAELAELSAALRAAQRELRGPRLRELSGQRRAAVAGLVAEARSLAAEADPGLPAARLPLAEVESTLQAALSDTDIAEQVRSGRLVRAASYAGFGEVPRPQLRLVTGGLEETPARRERPGGDTRAGGGRTGPERAATAGRRAAGARREERAAGRRTAAAERAGAAGTRAAEAREREARAARAGQRRALDRELTQARTGQERAESELAAAVTAEQEGAGELAEIETALAELERRRTAAEQEVSRRKLARRAAERAVVAARRHTGDVEAAIEAFEAEGEP
ncbi:hypothetical protein AB0J86_23355 [Micromonospora sp. NPDC049559]|uniref:hypothetical protein n=1 Tax=Micromonospora sp. NPDC049559 TaxID=3155923 RepID=UPI00341A0CE7